MRQRTFKDGYLFSALSIVFVLFLMALILFSGQYLRQSLAHAGLIDMLSSSSLKERDGERYLDVILDYPTAMQLVDKIFVRKFNISSQVLRGCYAILVHIKLKRYQEALEEAHSLSDYVSLHEYDQPQAESFDQILTDMSTEFDALNVSKENFQNIDAKLHNNVEALRTLSRDFADLLSMTPELPEDTAKLPEYYTGGVLAGLPKLSLLPDDIQDLSALKTTMESLGGEVRLQGENIHAQFQTRITQIREESQKRLAERQELQNTLAESRSRAVQQERKFSELASELSNLVLKFVESMSKPRFF